jgi:hypothetical protein
MPDMTFKKARDLKVGDRLSMTSDGCFIRTVIAVDLTPDNEGQIAVWLDVDYDRQRPLRYLPSDRVQVTR